MANNNVEIKVSLAGVDQVRGQTLQLADGFDRIKASAADGSVGADRLSSSLGRVAQYGIAGGSIYALASGVMNVGMALLEASSNAQRLATQLNFATDGRGTKELAWVSQLANELGLNLNTTAKAYAGFAAASRGTALQGQATRDVFEAIAKASAVMGLSSDETSGALLAVQQMMSKGVVSAEEFRGQLGERMPIALQAGAQALGVTTAQFSKMMEEGKVVSQDFLPKFAAAINTMLGDSVTDAANRLDAATQRMGSSWEKLKQTVGDTGLSKAVSNEMTGISNYMNSVSDSMANAKASGAGFVMQMSTGLGEMIARAPFDVLSASANILNGTINGLTGGVMHLNTNVNLLPDALNTNAVRSAHLEKKLSDAKSELAQLQQQLALAPTDIYLKSETYQAWLLVQQLEAAKRAKAELAGGGAGRGSVNPQTIGQRQEEQDKLASDLSALQTKLSGVPQDYIKTMSEIGRLHAAGALIGKEYTDAIEAAHKMLKDGKDTAKETVDVNKELVSSVQRTVAATNAEAAAEEALTPLQKYRARLYAEIATEKKAYTLETLLAIDATLDEAITQEKLNRSHKDAVKAREDLANADAKLILSADNELAKALEEYDAHNKLASVLQEEALARLEVVRAAALMGHEDTAVLDAQIDAKRKLIDVLRNGEVRDASEKSAKDAAKEWDKAIDDIEKSLTDAIMRGGKSAGEYLQDYFRTLVLRPIVSAVMQPIAGAAMGALGFANSANAASTVPTLVNIAGMTSAASGAFSAGMASAFAGPAAAMETASAGMTMMAEAQGMSSFLAGGAQTLGAVAPYALAAYAAYTVLETMMGGNMVSAAGTGEGGRTYNAAGQVTSTYAYAPFGGMSALADQSINAMAQQYFSAAAALGINPASQVYFSSSSNTGRQGENPNVLFGSNAGTDASGWNSGEVSLKDSAAVQLAASRAVLNALKNSELPGYLSKLFDGLTVSTATQDQISATLNYAQSLKTLREAMTETREPFQILKDTVLQGFKDLGTSASTYKADLVAAIDAGLEPTALARWQSLAGSMSELDKAIAGITDTIDAEVARIRGIVGGSTTSYAGAQAAFAIATAQARAGDTTAASSLPKLSQTLLELARDNVSTLSEFNRISAMTANSLAATSAGYKDYSIPALATGTNYVPADGPAYLHQGEAVIPRAYNPAAGGAGNNNAELVAEVKALRQQVENLQAAMQATAVNTGKTSRLLDRAMPDGDAMAVRTAA